MSSQEEGLIEKPNLSQLPDWIISDLDKSGLTPDNFRIELLKDMPEIKKRLGFYTIKDISGKYVKFRENDGYWIPYPNAPDYYRLKLRSPINTNNGIIKYLSPKKEMCFVNKPYTLPQVQRILEIYKPDEPILITEGEKNAAKATLEGFPCIGLSEVWNFKDSENNFLPELDGYNWKDRSVYIVFDSVIANKHNVKQAEIRLAIKLINRGAKVLSIRIPSESNGDKNGLDDYLVCYGNEAFQDLIKNARPTLEVHVKDGTDYRFILRELTKLDNEVIRVKTIKTLAQREGANMEAMEADYRKYIPKCKIPEPVPVEKYSDEEIKRAQELLKSPDILSRLTAFTERLGFIGEEINQQLLYLSFTSRLMDESISMIVKGSSASGKSYLTETILRLFPEDDVLNFSFITPKALVYRDQDLNHKILYIVEHSGSEGADYSIRTLLSEGELSSMSAVKNEATGNFETKEKRIPAKGLVLVQTTTRNRVHAENQTRVFDIYVDDSETQTGNILRMQAKQVDTNNPEIENEIKIWRAAQSILENYIVHIPYTMELADAFPKEKIRARRDFPRLLSLIKTHTLHYQYQRKIDQHGRLIAEVNDFEAILPLAELVLPQSMKELSPNQERAILILRKEFSDSEFSTKEAHNKVSELVAYSTLQSWFKQFQGDILEWNGGKGAASRYTFLTPDRSLGNTRIFSSNFLESLKNKYLEPEIGNVRQSGNQIDKSSQLPKSLELPGIEDEVIKSNKNREIREIKAITQLPMKGLNGDRPGSTDPEDWDNQVEEFSRESGKKKNQ